MKLGRNGSTGLLTFEYVLTKRVVAAFVNCLHRVMVNGVCYHVGSRHALDFSIEGHLQKTEDVTEESEKPFSRRPCFFFKDLIKFLK
ncbi:hypothetical protein CEXT_80391 [Caerostris extrusa]|uniref:Uncharacterized protein n=1 Tax=Caerostris extrusa TaxID=172846 RepID=A0AAV4S838_CAEEX|nr:hypothetical protein CEXT_80391 [Caerostris extrusa]